MLIHEIIPKHCWTPNLITSDLKSFNLSRMMAEKLTIHFWTWIWTRDLLFLGRCSSNWPIETRCYQSFRNTSKGRRFKPIFISLLIATSMEKIWNLVISFPGNFAFGGKYLQFWGEIYHLDRCFGLFSKIVWKFVKYSIFGSNLWPYSREIWHFFQPCSHSDKHDEEII